MKNDQISFSNRTRAPFAACTQPVHTQERSLLLLKNIAEFNIFKSLSISLKTKNRFIRNKKIYSLIP